MLRPEQKSFDAIRFLKQRFVSTKLSVMDPCFRTGVTSKECVLERNHQKLHGCEADGRCVKMMMASLLEEFASQFFKKKLNIKEELRVEKSGKAFVNARNTSRDVRQKQVWPHPRSLPPVQLATHIVQFLPHTLLYEHDFV